MGGCISCYTHTHTFLPVLKLLCILQVDGVELDGLVVVLHECERVSKTVARLRNKCRVIYFTCHCHSCAVVTRTAVITNDPYEVYIHTMYYHLHWGACIDSRVCLHVALFSLAVLSKKNICISQVAECSPLGCIIVQVCCYAQSLKIAWERGSMCGW